MHSMTVSSVFPSSSCCRCRMAHTPIADYDDDEYDDDDNDDADDGK
jgi:hypothetical protein